MPVAFSFFEAVDRLDVAAAVARLDFGLAFEEAPHRVRFGRFCGRFGDLRRAEVTGHGEVDRPHLGTGAKPAAGGRERHSEKEQRTRDRRTAARHQLPTGHCDPRQTGAAADGMSSPSPAISAVGSVSVIMTLPFLSVGPIAPVTAAPCTGRCLPFSLYA